MTWVHWVQVGIGAILAAATAAAQSDPALAPAMHIVTEIGSVVLTVVGILSPSVSHATNLKAVTSHNVSES